MRATLILYFSLFFEPFCFFESFLCSFLSLARAFLKNSGLSITLPSDKVKKCFKPKSNPRELLTEILLSSMNCFGCSLVCTMKLMKYCPEGFFETVAVPIFPFLTLLLKTNLILLSPSFFCLDELWNLDLLCLEINLHSARTLKTLMIVMLALKLWKATLMSEESLECFVKMGYCRSHTLDIDFSYPKIIFLELMILI